MCVAKFEVPISSETPCTICTPNPILLLYLAAYGKAKHKIEAFIVWQSRKVDTT